jgi:hypothetical protein
MCICFTCIGKRKAADMYRLPSGGTDAQRHGPSGGRGTGGPRAPVKLEQSAVHTGDGSGRLACKNVLMIGDLNLVFPDSPLFLAFA